MFKLGEDDAAFFAEHYDVTEGGNFEGHTILNRLQQQERSAADEARRTFPPEWIHAYLQKPFDIDHVTGMLDAIRPTD